MSIFKTLAAILAPHDCLGCNSEGSLMCAVCMAGLPMPMPQCYRCQRPSEGFLTCRDCMLSTPLERVMSATYYEGIAKRLVWLLKSRGAQAAAVNMAKLIGLRLPVSEDYRIVPVPTASSRVRQRGYDQATLLARSLSRQTGASYLPCLVRTGQTHQVGASRSQRMKQLKGSFRVRNMQGLAGARVLLIDDVCTTGASLESASRALEAAGVTRVDAAVFAQTVLK